MVEMKVMIPEKQKEAVETTWDVIFHLRVGVWVIFEDINFEETTIYGNISNGWEMELECTDLDI